MKLLYSPTSPYVRKVTIVAMVTDLADAIERVTVAPHPLVPDRTLTTINPLGKAPTLICDDGTILYDSRVIIEYLDARTRAAKVIPPGDLRWKALARQALGDGILDAALLLRYEGLVREPALQSHPWRRGQEAKIDAALEVATHQLAITNLEFDVGNIAIGAALGFLDFRLPELEWRLRHPALANWFAAYDAQPIALATRPVSPI
ncbi:glutathione S-transferase family protein [Devosia ginsengisoli]|uniref:glutathione S-transferase family protein n=1 Tax=Devosia ginsengisoli TaxID=400770 RepID=UPI0026F22682|nr:glutathione S-transferase family protein [Devosia ginsengisoli]MCR6671297.1 glutathione S-transferase family protein [Devosia ginsengisoli]